MNRCFVVVSGVPGSGKSTLAQQLAGALGLSLLDKDDILERLFESKGVGDFEWRRVLSRQSDLILETEARASDGAVLVSHWRVPGMPSNSGTPTEWITGLSANVIHVTCECPAEVASERFFNRRRHPGHLDHEKSRAEILTGIHELSSCGQLEMGQRIDVDTSRAVDLEVVLGKIETAFKCCIERALHLN